MKTFISKLGTDYPIANGPIYAQLVYKLQIVKKDDLAKAMLEATTALDPTTPTALKSLIDQASGKPAPALTTSAPSKSPVATATYNGLKR